MEDIVSPFINDDMMKENQNTMLSTCINFIKSNVIVIVLILVVFYYLYTCNDYQYSLFDSSDGSKNDKEAESYDYSNSDNDKNFIEKKVNELETLQNTNINNLDHQWNN